MKKGIRFKCGFPFCKEPDKSLYLTDKLPVVTDKRPHLTDKSPVLTDKSHKLTDNESATVFHSSPALLLFSYNQIHQPMPLLTV